MRYVTVHEDLLDAFPELRRPYERLVEDWGDFDEEPPGQYIVFGDVLGVLVDAVLGLPPETPGRDELLVRALDLAEAMLGADDAEVASLGIDAIVERFDADPAGPEFVARHAGRHVRAWFAAYSSGDWSRRRDDELIDLWGVRDELAAVLPATPLTEIPGISQPRAFRSFASLEEARASSEGTVLLVAFGETRLYAVLRAADIAVDEAALRNVRRGNRGRVRGRRSDRQAGRPVSADSARGARVEHGAWQRTSRALRGCPLGHAAAWTRWPGPARLPHGPTPRVEVRLALVAHQCSSSGSSSRTVTADVPLIAAENQVGHG